MKITKKLGTYIVNKFAIQPLLLWLYSQKWYSDVIMKWIPIMRLSTTYPVPENKDFLHWGALKKKGYAHLKKGDILFSRDEKKVLTGIIGKATGVKNEDFVPAHSALVVSLEPFETFEVAEMTSHDFTESTFSDICHESTRVAIGRCTDFSEEYIDKVLIPECMKMKNKKYDVRFIQGSQELICSELVYFADKGRKLDVDLTPRFGAKDYISPMGLMKGKNVKIVWDSNKETK